MYCKNCGAELLDLAVACVNCGAGKDSGDRFCAYCGAQLRAKDDRCPACSRLIHEPKEKGAVPPDRCRISPVTAAFASFVIAGLAQVINGQAAKGLLIFFLGVLLPRDGVFLWLRLVYAAVAAMDAYVCASRMKKGETIRTFSVFFR